MAKTRDPMSSPGRREVIGDTPPDVSAAARRVVLRRYASGESTASETRELLLMLGLVDERGRGVA